MVWEQWTYRGQKMNLNANLPPNANESKVNYILNIKL